MQDQSQELQLQLEPTETAGRVRSRSRIGAGWSRAGGLGAGPTRGRIRGSMARRLRRRSTGGVRALSLAGAAIFEMVLSFSDLFHSVLSTSH